MQKVPCTIHNLAELKRQIVHGAEMITLSHAYHPDMIGLVRVILPLKLIRCRLADIIRRDTNIDGNPLWNIVIVSVSQQEINT